MKKIIEKTAVCFGICCLLLAAHACKEYGPAPLPKGFSEEILQIIPETTIDSLIDLGLEINEGFNPPDITGSYYITPFILTIPYGPDDGLSIGHQFSDYKYTFSNFDFDELTLQIDFKSIQGNAVGEGSGGFVSGDGNGFTIFSEADAFSNGVNYKEVAILSGKLIDGDIHNFQYAFLITSKEGDEQNQSIIPVGTGRVVVDGDSLSEGVECRVRGMIKEKRADYFSPSWED